MSRAVKAVGLEPEFYPCTDSLSLNSLIYGYVAMGLPVILIVEVDGQGHAVTIAGYSILGHRHIEREDMAPASPPVRRLGLRIDEWYGHDDQVGPFARMKVRPRVGASGSAVEFIGSWADGTEFPMIPRHVIVPVYHKIRLSFLDIQPWLAHFSRLAAQVLSNYEAGEWDLRLVTTNDFKAEMRSKAPSSERERLLLRPYPHYLWRATFGTSSAPAVELLFDATDMARSYPFCDAMFYDAELARRIGLIVREPTLQNGLADVITPQFRDFLRDQTARAA